MNEFDVVIIGGGPVGIFSIFSCGLDGLSCAIIDANSELGGQCSNIYAEKYIYDIPGYVKIKAKDLVSQLILQAKTFNPYILLNDIVSSIKRNDNGFFEIKTKADVAIKTKSVLLALGAGIFTTIRLNVPGSKSLEWKRVFYDFPSLELVKDKTVVVLGGGDSALDYAKGLSETAKKVYLLHRRDIFKGYISGISDIHQISNIECKTNVILEKLEDCEDHIKLFYNQNTILNCDYIFPCYGITSNIGFLEQWDIQLKDNKVLVDENMQTSIEGVFAIGDCVFGEKRRNLLITGFSEAVQVSRSIAQFLYPNRAFNSSYSTNMVLFKNI